MKKYKTSAWTCDMQHNWNHHHAKNQTSLIWTHSPTTELGKKVINGSGQLISIISSIYAIPITTVKSVQHMEVHQRSHKNNMKCWKNRTEKGLSQILMQHTECSRLIRTNNASCKSLHRKQKVRITNTFIVFFIYSIISGMILWGVSEEKSL